MEEGTWIKITSLLAINFTALFGNILLLMIGMRNKSLRSFQNAFIFNMAFADFLQAVFIMPTASINLFKHKWDFSKISCDIFAILKVVFTLVSVYSLAGISLQRYFFVVKRKVKVNNFRIVLIGVAVIWGTSFLLSITPLFNWGVFGFEDGKEVCTVQFHLTPSHTLVVFTTGLLFNVFVMLFCYVMIYKTLICSKRKLSIAKDNSCTTEAVQSVIINVRPLDKSGDLPPFFTTRNDPLIRDANSRARNNVPISSNLTANQSKVIASVRKEHKSISSLTKKELRLLKTIAVVIAVFLCCWTPYTILNLLRAFKMVGNLNSMDTLTMWLGFANSAFNPVIYGVLNNQFKKAIKEILCCFAS
ncbi:dopamine D2-like receptor [Hydractinia symbiolongicarpus]|uniref:dopamine D2-like receptor n=1 Tax=Hydractinia symbiolongicarpus TaxID=13093 RepID=UPI00254B4D0F|nr:dopamine D2-like receptor [Hydractinia symbiolongicarpus]